MGSVISRPRNWTHMILINTGDKKGAATDANIFVTLTDERGRQTSETKCDARWKNDFKAGACDKFYLEFANLGIPKRLKIRKGKSTIGDSWYIQKIVVKCREGHETVFPVHRWLDASSVLCVEEFDCALPQNEKNPEQRLKELKRKREIYKLEEKMAGTPLQVETLPSDETFSNSYLFDIGGLAVKSQLHTKFVDFSTPRFQSLKDFEKLYRGKVLTRPYGIDNWESDEEFGNQRLSGCNPVLIKLCTKIPDHMPVSASLLEKYLEGFSLQEALERKKIYWIDLRYLAEIECNEGRKLPGPTGIFYSNKSGDFVPIAIQLMPEPSTYNPIFTPETGHLKYTWLVAKMWFNLADASHHQSATHLGFTHLIMETIAVCVHHQLSPSHPIFKLLAPHFLYLLAINAIGVPVLLNVGGMVDTVMYMGRTGMSNIIRHEWKDWYLQENGNVVGDLKRRGVDDVKALPNYHYRDDALLLWGAIEKYVAQVVNGFYDTPEKLANDHELQGWAKELSDPKVANIKGVPTVFKTNEQLIEVVACVIFTGSVGHAAANFNQYDEYGFPPNYPGNLRGSPPKTIAVLTEADVVDLLPDKKECLEMLLNVKILSEKATNELANYEVQYAYDPITLEARKKLKAELVEIGKTIDDRNKKRIRKYPYLHPTSVPNAISI